MQFNPGVNDVSGQIIGQGVAGAADTRAKMMSQMGQDIGGAIESIGGALTNSLEFNNMGDSAYEGIKAIGEMYPGMKSVATSLSKLDKRTQRMASLSIMQNFGAVSQFAVAGMNNQTRQQAPIAAANLQNVVDGAAGRTTYEPSPGLSSVVPPPSPAGFGSINQGMPGAMPMTQVNPSRRPMATRPGGR
jgi:hypothetical protein